MVLLDNIVEALEQASPALAKRDSLERRPPSPQPALAAARAQQAAPAQPHPHARSATNELPRAREHAGARWRYIFVLADIYLFVGYTSISAS